jgi:hypothetical protein
MKEGSKRYKALLDEALDLHLRKNRGYSAQNPDAFANFRLAEGMGLTAVQGVLVRMGDKFARVQSLARDPSNDKVGESMRDTLMDLSAYALIAICLMEEEKVDELPACCSVGCQDCIACDAEGKDDNCSLNCAAHREMC